MLIKFDANSGRRWTVGSTIVSSPPPSDRQHHRMRRFICLQKKGNRLPTLLPSLLTRPGSRGFSLRGGAVPCGRGGAAAGRGSTARRGGGGEERESSGEVAKQGRVILRDLGGEGPPRPPPHGTPLRGVGSKSPPERLMAA